MQGLQTQILQGEAGNGSEDRLVKGMVNGRDVTIGHVPLLITSHDVQTHTDSQYISR